MSNDAWNFTTKDGKIYVENISKRKVLGTTSGEFGKNKKATAVYYNIFIQGSKTKLWKLDGNMLQNKAAPVSGEFLKNNVKRQWKVNSFSVQKWKLDDSILKNKAGLLKSNDMLDFTTDLALDLH